MKRTFIALLLASMMVLVMGTATFASSGTWQHDGYGWWYAYDEGGYPVNRWEYDNGYWYHFNGFGYMDTGWLYDGAWYYLNPDGTMATGWVWDGTWYYLYPTGALATGWITDGYSWYYMGSDGAMKTGWIQDGAWYYLNSDGTMATGWVTDGYNWYYLGLSGAMQTGWLEYGEDWYYLNPSGAMVTGYLSIDKKQYYFDKSGICNNPQGTSVNAPDDAVAYNGHWYKIYREIKNWTNAKEYCEELGGHLATITSENEQEFIEQLNSNSKRLWIGGYRDNNSNIWKWVTGEPWDYNNWGSGEPNNSTNVISNENRVSVWPKLWNDLNEKSREQSGFICEWE